MANFNLNENDFCKIVKGWDEEIERDAKYWRENDAKLRAVASVNSYEEFSEIVKAAHLQPLKRMEIVEMHTKNPRIWNNITSHSVNSKQPGEATITAKEVELIIPKSPAEFVHSWNKLDNQSRLDLLQQIPLVDLNNLLQVEAPPGMLGDLAVILQPSTDKAVLAWQAQLMRILTLSSRFSLNLKFLSTSEKNSYKLLCETLNKQEDLKDILNNVYKEFELN